MRELLCNVLAKYAGQELTRATAVEIVKQLFPDKSHSPALFGTRPYKGYTLQCESVADMLDEFTVLRQGFHAETDLAASGQVFAPEYQYLIDKTHAGEALLFTARAAAAAVGYMMVYLSRDLDTGALVCNDESFYIAPAHRGGFLAVRLWQFAEAAGQLIGVREVNVMTKLGNNVYAMARYMGYACTGQQNSKQLTPKGLP